MEKFVLGFVLGVIVCVIVVVLALPLWQQQVGGADPQVSAALAGVTRTQRQVIEVVKNHEKRLLALQTMLSPADPNEEVVEGGGK